MQGRAEASLTSPERYPKLRPQEPARKPLTAMRGARRSPGPRRCAAEARQSSGSRTPSVRGGGDAAAAACFGATAEQERRSRRSILD